MHRVVIALTSLSVAPQMVGTAKRVVNGHDRSRWLGCAVFCKMENLRPVGTVVRFVRDTFLPETA